MTCREVKLVVLVVLLANLNEIGFSAALSEFANIIDVEFEIPNTHAQARTSNEDDFKRVTETKKSDGADTGDGLKKEQGKLGLDGKIILIIFLSISIYDSILPYNFYV